jgi:hypothetical protein
VFILDVRSGHYVAINGRYYKKQSSVDHKNALTVDHQKRLQENPQAISIGVNGRPSVQFNQASWLIAHLAGLRIVQPTGIYL